MRINVKDTQVHERSFQKNGQTQIMRSQRAALDTGGGYELPFRVGLGTGPVYPVGAYDLDPESFQLNPYGDLILGRVKLVPHDVSVGAQVAASREPARLVGASK
jgi:hypothetical protein